MPSEEDPHTSAMVAAVQDMALKLERFQRHADEERAKLGASVDATVAAMREDFWQTTIAIQRDATVHRDEHIVERKERAADIVQRTQRQATVDNWMGALTILAVINLVALVVLIAIQAYGR